MLSFSVHVKLFCRVVSYITLPSLVTAREAEFGVCEEPAAKM